MSSTSRPQPSSFMRWIYGITSKLREAAGVRAADQNEGNSNLSSSHTRSSGAPVDLVTDWDFDMTTETTQAALTAPMLTEAPIYAAVPQVDLEARRSESEKSATSISAADSEDLLRQIDEDGEAAPQSRESTSNQQGPGESFVQSHLSIAPGAKEWSWRDAWPGLFFWLVSGVICMLLEEWTIVAGSVGALSTAVLVYILPSMLYFRVGLDSDYQQIPVCGLIPNRVFFLASQLLGVALLLGNTALMVFYACGYLSI